MEIVYFEKIDSTHRYLLNSIKERRLHPPVCVVAHMQTDGIGSRGNHWISQKGNLFLSFCVDLKQLPKDLPLQSISIYFSFLLKELLSERGSKVWVKWPNDFYLEDKKIGGVITAKVGTNIICSIGLNISSRPDDCEKLDITVDKEELVTELIDKIKENISWKQAFSKYKIEFQKAKKFTFHFNGEVKSFKDAKLNKDGSITIADKKIYSLR